MAKGALLPALAQIVGLLLGNRPVEARSCGITVPSVSSPIMMKPFSARMMCRHSVP
jgi:hypothetical protein